MKATYAPVTLVLLLCLLNSGTKTLAQDAFDSTVVTGTNYTGSQTTQGGYCSPPILQGVTNGIIGPDSFIGGFPGASEDGKFHDSPLSLKEQKLRDAFIKPVSCQEPVPQGLFPPMPQVPALPEIEVENYLLEISHEKEAKKQFESGKSLINSSKLQQASAKFILAVKNADDELFMQERIAAFLARNAEKRKRKQDSQKRANLLRLACFFDPANSNYSDLLCECLQTDGKKAGDPVYRSSLASELESQGNYPMAVAEWRAALKADDSLSNRALLASALILADSDREALAELRSIVKAPEDNSASDKIQLANCHRQLAELYLKYSNYFEKRGAFASSIALLETGVMEARRACVLNPQDSRAIKILLAGSLDATAYSPDEIDNHFLLAAAYLLKGDLQRANIEYGDCGRLDESDPRLAIARLVYQRAASKRQAPVDQLKSNIARVKRLIDQDPDNEQLWTLLGRLHMQASEPEKAKAAFDQAKTVYWSAPVDSLDPPVVGENENDNVKSR